MNLDDFYSNESIEVWETILGEKMHYHYATESKDNDPFDQSVIDLFPYIKPNSKILDCGCGWGGPGKLIKEKLNCDITGVTISKSQEEYIKHFPVIHADLENFIPTEHYDTAIFIESYTHIINTKQMLCNIKKNVDNIIIKDYLSTSDSEFAIPLWGMRARLKKTFFSELNNAGYIIKDYYEIPNVFEPATDYWMENLMKLDPSQITGHVKRLFELCYAVKYKNHQVPYLNLCVIHASK
jgi:hypothetical protein